MIYLYISNDIKNSTALTHFKSSLGIRLNELYNKKERKTKKEKTLIVVKGKLQRELYK